MQQKKNTTKKANKLIQLFELKVESAGRPHLSTDSMIRFQVALGYLAEYLLLHIWTPPYCLKKDKKTVKINHKKQSNRWFLSFY